MAMVFLFLRRAADEYLRLPEELKAEAAEMLDHLRDRLGRDIEVEGIGEYRGRVRMLFQVAQNQVVVVAVEVCSGP